MKNIRTDGELPSKGREVGARRRHERDRARMRRYKTIGCLRFATTANVPSYDPTTGQRRSGDATWSDVLAWRMAAARRQLDTRTPCSCPVCGNARASSGDSLQEKRAKADFIAQISDDFS